MAAHGVRMLRGKEPQLRKLIYELRYEQGYLYLDRCGRILDRIGREKPEWMPAGEISPQQAPLFNIQNRIRFTFGAKKIDLLLDQMFPGSPLIDESARAEFARAAEDMSRLVVQELQLESFARIGVRSFFQFSMENETESQQWLAGLGLFAVSPKFLGAFHSKSAAADLTAVLVGEECRYRVEVSSIETVTQLDMGGGQALAIREKGIEPQARLAFNKRR